MIKILLIVAGSLLVLEVVFLAFVSNYNMGWLLTIFMGLFFLLYGIFFDQINNFMSQGVLLWLRYLGYLLLACLFGVIIFLASYGNHDNVTYREDAVIVLGAGLRGDKVSLTLAKRLDAAYEYWLNNPEAIIVTTGGQGPQETIPEGQAEAKYLLNLGVPRSKIIIEAKSTSTRENFLFAQELLAEKLPSGYKVAYVTNSFHIYRAGKIAQDIGLSASHYHGDLSWYMVPVVYLREFAAVIVYWL